MFKNLGKLDLTQGNPSKQIILFSIPLIIGNFAQQLYNTVDSIVVSRFVGDHALGAVGASFPIINFLLIIFAAIATGASVLVGQYFGAKDKENLAKTIGTCLTWTFYSSIILSFVGFFATDSFLSLLKTPPELFAMTSIYLKTIFVGVLGMAMYNIVSGCLRAVGDTVYPLYALLICTVLNIGLDIFFVASLGMGVFGVAIATVIAQSISAVFCIVRLNARKDILHLQRSDFNFYKDITKKMFAIGLPSSVTQCVFALAMLLLQGLSNSFGATVVTASTTVMRIDGFVILPIFTFGIAATTFTSQNIGAKKLDRVKEGATAALKISLACSITLALLVVLFGIQLAEIFTSTQAVLDYSARFLKILSVGYVLFTFTQVLGGVMRGAGDSVTPMWISVFAVLFVRTPAAYLLVELSKQWGNPAGDPTMVMFGHCIGWVTSGFLSIYFYKKGTWKKKINYILSSSSETQTVEAN